jgi:Ca2+-binding RTX toxin-like protein
VISDPQRGLPRRTRHIAPTLALITALLFAGSALSAVRIGTNGSETIVGTNGNDQLNGKGGDDILKGKAGNDMYYFADAWGSDSLVETAKGGIDTVNFHHVVTGPVAINLVPEWTSLGSNFNGVVSLSSSRVQFSYTLNGKAVESFVENAIG